MALAILDGTQTATTLSTILSSGQHITAHTVVSLGTQAITDMRGAVSGSVVSVSSLPAISGTVTANVFGYDTGNQENLRIGAFSVGDRGVLEVIGVNGNPLPISGTVTVGNSVNINSLPSIRINPNYNGQDGNNGPVVEADSGVGSDPRYMVFAGGLDGVNGEFRALSFTTGGLAVAGTVTVGNSVTIGAGTVTIGAGTAQIGSVTASISNSVTIASLPAISGTVTANLSISATAITSGSFTSLASATLVPGNTARKMATVYNLGAGQLFVNAGSSATTLGGGFMVALNSGDFYECNYTTTTLSAIFATAGTASWVSH